MANIALDVLLLKLREGIDYLETHHHSIVFKKDQITFIFEELEFLRTFLKNSKKEWYEHGEIKDLVTQIIDLGYEVADALDLSNWVPNYACLNVDDVRKEINSILKVVMEFGTRVRRAEFCSHESSSSSSAPNSEEETVVGFEEVSEMIKYQLVGEPQQLEVISIYGMGGSGKTTLATKLYNDRYIIYHFFIRCWTFVSQEYRKRDVLFRILSSIVRRENIYTMTDQELGEKLYRELKGKRYFIVMDDLWHIKAWNDLKRFFPDDNNGSRIMLTSRHKEVALNAKPKPDSPIHFLRFLTENESWELLEQKVFLKETCPLNLVEIGKKIARKCQGLPLAIVVVAGLLAKTDKTQDWWNQVAETVSTFLISDPKQCLDTLALSYNHLPHYLKSCFLYFGAFIEDYEIPLQKLIWLWIAEGFIDQIGQKSLEDVAEEYLMDLIDRSLVLVAKKGSIGRIKACRVHDLLRDLCLRKAKEENFLEQLYGYEQLAYFFNSSCRKNKQVRVSIHSRFFNLPPEFQHIRSCLCYSSGPRPLSINKTKFIYASFKLLRVLDLSSILIMVVTEAIKDIVHLRYLALQIDRNILLAPIFELWNLETLILSTWVSSMLPLDIPHTIWKMVKLRHIQISCPIKLPTNGLYPSVLDDLQTLSLVWPPKNFENVLASTPNLKKLGFSGSLIQSWKNIATLPNLKCLTHLETLKLLNTTFKLPVGVFGTYVFQLDEFPASLKILTLTHTFLEWKEMSSLGMLPNLEVLKLRHEAFIGPKWETRDGEFCRLKFLKLEDLPIVQWNTSDDHFPSLQHLVLYSCQKLKEIPPSLGDIPTLQIIELKGCSYSAVNSAREIQEEQEGMGNDLLKILTNCFDEEIAM